MPDAPTPSTAWNDALLKNPHAVADKRTRVQKMFAAIAPSYDLNNRLHSLWMDQQWRKKAVTLAELNPSDRVVDVACGTGDLTYAFARRAVAAQNKVLRANPPAGDACVRPPAPVIGIDFTFAMLPIARRKAATAGPYEAPSTKESREICRIVNQPWTPELHKQEIAVNAAASAASVRFINGDALSLPLGDQSADVLSIAFGIRNVQDPAAAIKEFHRVLRPNGRLIILEFSLPTNPVLRTLYNFYFRQILPRTATLISGDKTGAYKYLPESVNTFISRQSMQDMMRQAGFQDVQAFPLTFGVCVCYRGLKP
jgi:demethylmenaquinone methyltransferase/2-methoxy-6-polyprenyl-1,4-benzoquinol methylase